MTLLGLGLWVIIHRHSPTSLSSAPAKAATVQTSGAQNAAPVGQSTAVTTPATGKASAGRPVSSPPAPAAGRLALAQSQGKAATSRSLSQPVSAPGIPGPPPVTTTTANTTPSSQVPPPAAEPSATKSAATGRVVTLACKHELESGTLKITSGALVIFQSDLEGKKRTGFLGITGGFAGALTRSITIPADASELTLQVSSEGGAAGLIRKVAARPPSGSSDTLQVTISRGAITAQWAAPPAPKK